MNILCPSFRQNAKYFVKIVVLDREKGFRALPLCLILLKCCFHLWLSVPYLCVFQALLVKWLARKFQSSTFYFIIMISIYLVLKTFFPIFSGLEISDVLKIDDKDYSITFSLYFNVQWSEPRLNLSREFLDTENITAEEDQLVPGKQIYNFPMAETPRILF